MTTLKLNKKLLKLLLMVEYYCKLKAKEDELLNKNIDYYEKTRQYYFDLPDQLIDELGLAKNEACFEAIWHFNITDEMTATPFNELDKFEFKY